MTALLSVVLVILSASSVQAAGFVPRLIAFSDAQHGIAADDDAVATTDDGGSHWIVRRKGLEVTLVRASGARAWLVSGKAVYESDDRGGVWHVVGIAKWPPLDVLNGTTWWAAPASPSQLHAFRTRDSGASWQPIGARCSSSLYLGLADLQFVSRDHGWALCSGCAATIMMCKLVAETHDGGRTWHENAGVSRSGHDHSGGLSLAGHPAGIFFLPDGHGWYWEGRGFLWRTIDGGHEWRRLDLLEPGVNELAGMSFVSDDVGFATFREPGGEFYVVRTTDGGVTWRSSRGRCAHSRKGYIACPPTS